MSYQTNEPDDTQMSVGRVEAFSDGVFGVAVTLLVLNIQVPHLQNAHVADLVNGLLNQWPSYVSYFITFMSMGTLWVHHHRAFKMLRTVDYTLQLVNVLFLMFVTL